ncbi:MAG: hypothetical protein AMJ90_03315 [candidate division Zixibacteria bacterium SM23_73_2]|nr:MAG: hypothetical protein AMJ90_03315 [candidate division Zixibacteria bacterium SM23_73_2]
MKSSKLYVGNLSYSIGENELRDLFSEFGNVVSVNILTGRGFGFVELDSAEAAKNAKEALDGTELDGRNLRIDEAKPQKQKRGGFKEKRDFGRGKRRPNW